MRLLPSHPTVAGRLPALAWSIVAAFPVLLAGCGTSRIEPPAEFPAPARFKEGSHATPDAPAVPDRWWALFNDPVLDSLQDRLLIGNENLRAALARTATARAVLEAAGAARRPELSAGLGVARSREPASTRGEGSGTTTRGTAELSLAARWELDLWGRLSQTIDSAQALHRASEHDLAAMRLSAQATLARAYFALRRAEARQALIERNIDGFQRSLGLTQARYDSGVAAQTDVLQAQTLLKRAQALAVESRAERSLLEHAIAVLLGQPPSALALDRTAALPAPPAVPPLLPSTLLARRPDIAAARQRLLAAHADIGVADAAFFPSLSLSAAAGYRGAAVDHLVRGPQLFWSIGPTVAQALFDGGRRRAVSDQARAEADRASADYRQTVLLALQEVEDNLMLADHLQTQAALEEEALRHARRNLEITQDQYRVGTVSYLNVVTAQTLALENEQRLLEVRGRQLDAVNQLLKNIAGRW